MNKKDIKHKVGDDIYIPTSLHLSRGSDDIAGGLGKITRIGKPKEKYTYCDIEVEVLELPGHSYNYEELLEGQTRWKKEYRKQRCRPDPDIDTPWIEPGDTVCHGSGKPYIANYTEW